MKYLKLPTLLFLVLASSACGTSPPRKYKPLVIQDQKIGLVKSWLINPSGQVDGIILVDGTQVKFPPALSSELISTISPKDKVKLSGFQENKILFEAETITNLKTLRSVSNADPIPPDPIAANHNSLALLTYHGTITVQLLGRRGEINGVILKNGTVVLFGPHLPQELGIQTAIGKRIEASGYGTENSLGQCIEATKISNF